MTAPLSPESRVAGTAVLSNKVQGQAEGPEAVNVHENGSMVWPDRDVAPLAVAWYDCPGVSALPGTNVTVLVAEL